MAFSGYPQDSKISELFKTVFNAPVMQQKEVLLLCEKMDAINKLCVKLLISAGSTFPLRVFAQTYSEVAAGITHGRLVYERNPKLNADKMIDPFRSAAEIDFLLQALPVVRLPMKNLKTEFNEIIDTIENAKFIRAVYENIISQFLKTTEEYQFLCWQATNYINKIHTHDKDEAHKTADELSKILDKIDNIEETTEIKDGLYSIISFIRARYFEYIKLKESILRAYLRIPLSLAKNRTSDSAKMLDNFQNGSEGLLQAISYYSKTMSNFSSYAKLWTKQAILFKIKEEGNAIRLPPNIWQDYTALEKHKDKLRTQKGRIQIEDLAKASGILPQRIKEIYDHVKSSQMKSIDAHIDDDNKTTLLDIIGKSDDYETIETNKDLHKKIKALDDESQFILAVHFGLFDLIPNKIISKSEVINSTLTQLSTRLKNCKEVAKEKTHARTRKTAQRKKNAKLRTKMGRKP